MTTPRCSATGLRPMDRPRPTSGSTPLPRSSAMTASARCMQVLRRTLPQPQEGQQLPHLVIAEALRARADHRNDRRTVELERRGAARRSQHHHLRPGTPGDQPDRLERMAAARSSQVSRPQEQLRPNQVEAGSGRDWAGQGDRGKLIIACAHRQVVHRPEHRRKHGSSRRLEVHSNVVFDHPAYLGNYSFFDVVIEIAPE